MSELWTLGEDSHGKGMIFRFDGHVIAGPFDERADAEQVMKGLWLPMGVTIGPFFCVGEQGWETIATKPDENQRWRVRSAGSLVAFDTAEIAGQQVVVHAMLWVKGGQWSNYRYCICHRSKIYEYVEMFADVARQRVRKDGDIVEDSCSEMADWFRETYGGVEDIENPHSSTGESTAAG